MAEGQAPPETNHTVDRIFEDRANDTGSPNAFIGTDDYTAPSKRTAGATLHLDPHATYGHLRALSGDLGMTAGEWRHEKDTTPPVVSGVGASLATAQILGGDGLPSFSPNGDGMQDRLSIRRTMSEPGTLETVVAGPSGSLAIRIVERVADGPGITTWTGRDADGRRVRDGLYRITLRPTDRAGNAGLPRTMSVRVLTPLKSPTVSARAIEVADRDELAPRVRFRATVTEAASISWKVVDMQGRVVRMGPRHVASHSGDVSFGWDGTDDSGQFVRNGRYRGLVSAATAVGTVVYGREIWVGAFRLTISQPLIRGRTVRISAYNTEPLTGPLSLTISQPGVSPYTLILTPVTSRRSSVTLRLKGSGASGDVLFAVKGTDRNRGVEMQTFTRRLH